MTGTHPAGLGELLDAGDGGLEIIDLGWGEDKGYQVLFHGGLRVAVSGMSRQASHNDVAIPARACHGICIYSSQLGENSPGASCGCGFRRPRASRIYLGFAG